MSAAAGTNRRRATLSSRPPQRAGWRCSTCCAQRTALRQTAAQQHLTLTVMEAVAEHLLQLATLVAVTVAVLSSLPAELAVVGEVMCTVRLVPAVTSPQLQVRMPPEMLQTASEFAASMAQGPMPVPVGRVSLRLTTLAVPAPAPLVTVILNPMVSPVLTLAASAVLVSSRDGACVQDGGGGTSGAAAEPKQDACSAAGLC